MFLFPPLLSDFFGVELVPPEEVVMKPSLIDLWG